MSLQRRSRPNTLYNYSNIYFNSSTAELFSRKQDGAVRDCWVISDTPMSGDTKFFWGRNSLSRGAGGAEAEDIHKNVSFFWVGGVSPAGEGVSLLGEGRGWAPFFVLLGG